MPRTATSKRKSIAIAVIAAGLGILGSFVFAQNGNAAAAGESVDSTNANLVAQCNVQTQTVTKTGQTLYYIGNQGYPASAAGYANNVFTSVTCNLYDENNAYITTYSRSTQGPWLISTRAAGLALPPTHRYHICTDGFVKLSNGTVSAVPTRCG